MQTVNYVVDDGVAHITLNRPDNLNALSRQLSADIARAFAQVEDDPAVRAVVLAGEGRAFCAGADLKDPDTHPATDIVGQLISSRGAGVDTPVAFCTRPVIAAVHGWAVGAGVEMAIAADVVVGAETARFYLPQVSLGILPGAGGASRLTRVIGKEWASRMILLGEKVDAPTALRIGLISEMVAADDLLGRANELARSLAALPPAAVRLAKQSIIDADDVPLRQALKADNYRLFILSGTDEKKSAHGAFAEARQ
ncbi:MAG: enoyl-CoA hydratase/isomerase family protein [Ilumatobacteraceae bacterium]